MTGHNKVEKIISSSFDNQPGRQSGSGGKIFILMIQVTTKPIIKYETVIRGNIRVSPVNKGESD